MRRGRGYCRGREIPLVSISSERLTLRGGRERRGFTSSPSISAAIAKTAPHIRRSTRGRTPVSQPSMLHCQQNPSPNYYPPPHPNLNPRHPLTSKQYPNSNPSPSSPRSLSPSLPPETASPNKPLLRPPPSPRLPGPSNLPTKKYDAVAITREPRRKCTNMKIRVRRMVAPTEVVEAMPHARPVRSWKAERR